MEHDGKRAGNARRSPSSGHRRFRGAPRHRGAALLLIAFGAMALGLSACGGGGPSASGVASLGTSTSPGTGGGSTTTTHPGGHPAPTHTNLVKFSECMRSHGITNFPDPHGGTITFNVADGIDPNSPTFKAAQQACRKYAPVRSPTSPQGGPSKAVLLKYAKCMRAHGVKNFPDPVQFPGGATWGFDLVGQVTQTSPAFQAANHACMSRAYGGIHPCGGGSRRAGGKERRC